MSAQRTHTFYNLKSRKSAAICQPLCHGTHINAVAEIWCEDTITIEIQNMGVDEAITLAAVYGGKKKEIAT